MTLNRAFAVADVKSVDDGRRIIEGVATTVRTDRMGDIVESRGVEYRLPVPVLLDHNPEKAVGEVISATISDTEIRFRAQIKTIDTPGSVKDLVDSAWEMAKAGLRRAVSIGFVPLAIKPLPDGGARFTRWNWLELSMVSIPANQDAVFQAKSLDAALTMARNFDRLNRKTARPAGRVVRLDAPIRARRRLDHDAIMAEHYERRGNLLEPDRSITMAARSAAESYMAESSSPRATDALASALAGGFKATEARCNDLDQRIRMLEEK